METVVPLVVGLSAALPAALLAGVSVVLVASEPAALGLSSLKFFFNHLDGKHMAGIELGGG